MDLNISFSIAMTLSLALLVLAVVIGVKEYRSEFLERGETAYKKHFVLSPFQMFLVCFFLATFCMFVPVYFFGYFKNLSVVERGINALFLSVYNTMKVFVSGGDFNTILEAVSEEVGVSRDVAKAYSIYASFIFFTAPVVTASFVLSFFKNASAYVKYFLSRSKKVYYISKINEKSIALATNILSECKKGKPLVVFFNATDNDEEAGGDLVDQAKRLGAICFKKEITEVRFKLFPKLAERRFYFIGEDEDKNVKQALTLIKLCKDDARYNSNRTEFYVFSTTVDSEALLDAVDNGEMKVRRINEDRNLVMNTLINEPVFEKFVSTEQGKRVSVLVVGSENFDIELIKALSWCAQIPGYSVAIHVVDVEDTIASKLAAIAPELVEKNMEKKDGEPYYEIIFHPEVDVMGVEFLDLLREIENITVAFVALGNDEANLDVAMRMRRECGRLNLKKEYEIPNIFAIIYNTIKTQTLLQNGGLLCLGDEDYGIKFIGDVRTRYSHEVIEQQQLEQAGMDIHLSWLECRKAEIRLAHEDEREINEQIEISRKNYGKYEYYRRASMGKAVYEELLKALGESFENDEAKKEFEHKRWNAFMRAEGYVYDANVKNHIAKTHTDLKPYENLTELEKKKDMLA